MAVHLSNFLYKPFATVSVELDMSKTGPTVQKKIKTSLERGFIDVRKGDSALVYGMLCQHYGLPTISVPTRGYRAKDLIVAFDTMAPEARALLWPEIQIIADNLFEAEMAAKKLIQHVPMTRNSFRDGRRKEIPEDWRSDPYSVDGRNIGLRMASWDFKITHPVWKDVFKPVFMHPLLADRFAQARAAAANGRFTLRETK